MSVTPCGTFAITKDPDADLDYAIDWTAWLAGDTIATSSWSVPANSGLVAHAESHGDAIATTWLRAGFESNSPWKVTNSIVTAAGRSEDRTIMVKVENR